MVRQFDNSDCSVVIAGGDDQISAPDLVSKGFVHTITARKNFRRLIGAINFMSLSAWRDSDVSLLSGERARQLADQFERGVRRGFFVIRIHEA